MDFIEGFGANVKGLNMNSVPMKGILKSKNGFGALHFEDLSNQNSEARSEMEHLKREMQRIKEQALREKKALQAERIALLEKHKAELAEKVAQAFRDGQEKGKAEAEAEHIARENEVFEGVKKAIENLEEQRQHFFNHAEEGIAQALSSMTRRIVGSWLDQCPGAVEGAVKEALGYLGHESHVRLLLNSSDFAWVQPRVKSWLDIGQGNVNIELIEENRLGRGGCVLETDSGKIEVRIESLLDEMEGIVAKYFRNVAEGQ